MGTTTAEAPARSLEDLGARQLTSTELTQVGRTVAKEAKADLVPYFEQNKAALAPLIPRGMSPDRLLSVARGVIRENPKLQECTVASLFGAIVKCATLGLEPNTHRGDCYLIPRSRRRPRRDGRGVIVTDEYGKQIWEDQYEVHVQIGTRGFVELAYRSPQIASIKAVAVFTEDEIEVDEGTTQQIRHKVDLRKPRGELIGAYAVASLRSGRSIFELVTLEDIEFIRDNYSDAFKDAKAKIAIVEAKIGEARTDAARDKLERELEKIEKTPWLMNTAEMAKGRALKLLCKNLPAGRDYNDAAALDGQARDLEAVLSGDFYEVIDSEDTESSGTVDDKPAEGAGAANAGPANDNPTNDNAGETKDDPRPTRDAAATEAAAEDPKPSDDGKPPWEGEGEDKPTPVDEKPSVRPANENTAQDEKPGFDFGEVE